MKYAFTTVLVICSLHVTGNCKQCCWSLILYSHLQNCLCRFKLMVSRV